MKLKLSSFITLLFISMAFLQAQDYQITFTGSGAASTVATVKIENLTQGTELTMNGSDILHLKNVITGIDSYSEDSNHRISFSPNPMIDYSLIKFDLPEDGQTTTSLYDITGRIILQIQDYLSKGQHTYRLQGINNGLYIVKVVSDRYSVTGRLLCSGSHKGEPKITYENAGVTDKEEYDLKGISAETVMQYTAGDRLKLTGVSGIYSTVVVDVPNSSKTITFTFIACTDGDGNNYPIVKIGDQTWMAENLKSTKNNLGELLHLGFTAETSDPAYAWYDNDINNKNVYGALYNWAAVKNANLCPAGWHIPNVFEWSVLTTFLVTSAGGKLKETGTNHWSDPNTGATNETGFTALPGGICNGDGSYTQIGLTGYWWCSDDTDMFIHYVTITALASTFQNSKAFPLYGYSIRCLKY